MDAASAHARISHSPFGNFVRHYTPKALQIVNRKDAFSLVTRWWRELPNAEKMAWRRHKKRITVRLTPSMKSMVKRFTANDETNVSLLRKPSSGIGYMYVTRDTRRHLAYRAVLDCRSNGSGTYTSFPYATAKEAALEAVITLKGVMATQCGDEDDSLP